MPEYRLDLSTPPDWKPLERFAELLVERQLPGPTPSDFMYMGRLVRGSLPPVHLYKHRRDRSYVMLDTGGHLWTVRSGAGGRWTLATERDASCWGEVA